MSPVTLTSRDLCDDDNDCSHDRKTSTAVIIVIIVVILILKICFWIAVCAYIKRRRARRNRNQVAYQGGWNTNQQLNNMPNNVDASNYPPPPPAYYGQGYARDGEGSPEVKGGSPNAAHVV